jgi:hypothetical protein
MLLFACTSADKPDDTSQPAPITLSESCDALEPAGAGTVLVPGLDLAEAVANAEPGSTLILQEGTYTVESTLELKQAGVSLRSQSGEPTSVILEGAFAVSSLISIQASDITIAGITLTHSYGPAIQVLPEETSITGTRLYQLVVRDAGEESIRIEAGSGGWADSGVIACSSLVRTESGRAEPSISCRGGVDAVSAADWRLYGNNISGFFCEDPVYAVSFRDGSRNTLLERNRIFDSYGLISLGDDDGPPATPRADDQSACPEGGDEVEHYGGLIQNNFLGLASEDTDFQVGLLLARACAVEFVHNTLWSGYGPIQSVLVFGAQTSANLTNNLVSVPFIELASLSQLGNSNASEADFVDAIAGDFHLVKNSSAIEAAAPGMTELDIDLETRSTLPSIGADEYSEP